MDTLYALTETHRCRDNCSCFVPHGCLLEIAIVIFMKEAIPDKINEVET